MQIKSLKFCKNTLKCQLNKINASLTFVIEYLIWTASTLTKPKSNYLMKIKKKVFYSIFYSNPLVIDFLSLCNINQFKSI